MVAVDAALRGLPVLVSDRGGLPEAGLGAAVVLPVAPMELPLGPGPPDAGGEGAGSGGDGGGGAGSGGEGGGGGSSGGSSGGGGDGGNRASGAAAAAPIWARRRFPPQPPAVVAAWAAALQRLLLDPGCAEAHAARGAAARAAAASLVRAQGAHLAALEAWLGSLERLP
jgi:hypothetical protein